MIIPLLTIPHDVYVSLTNPYIISPGDRNIYLINLIYERMPEFEELHRDAKNANATIELVQEEIVNTFSVSITARITLLDNDAATLFLLRWGHLAKVVD